MKGKIVDFDIKYGTIDRRQESIVDSILDMVPNMEPPKKWSDSYVSHSHSMTVRGSIGLHHINLIGRSQQSHVSSGRTTRHILLGHTFGSLRGSE